MTMLSLIGVYPYRLPVASQNPAHLKTQLRLSALYNFFIYH